MRDWFILLYTWNTTLYINYTPIKCLETKKVKPNKMSLPPAKPPDSEPSSEVLQQRTVRTLVQPPTSDQVSDSHRHLELAFELGIFTQLFKPQWNLYLVQVFFFLGFQNLYILFLGTKITADGDCSHEIKRHLLLGRKAMTNLGC